MRKINVLITGRSRDEVGTAAAIVNSNARCKIEARVITNGHVDPLHGTTRVPDLMLLCDIQAEEELRAVANTPAGKRPALVVFGPGEDANSVRNAMRAGARDYLTLPINEDELHEIINQVAAEVDATDGKDSGILNVFINGKGGSGATFLAANVAHGLASNDNRVTLMDLDLQFAGMCRYLDLKPSQDILDAVQSVDDMDELSAEAFSSEHESGLRLLSGKGERLVMNNEISSENVVGLLRSYQQFNDFVIVDLPRHIDDLNSAVLENADRISVVMQQSFPHLHDTARLLHIMRHELGIANSQITVVVNRYSKDSAILLRDIENALRVEDIVKIPNHYRATTESINTGIPLSDISRKASVSKGLKDLYQNIGGFQEAEPEGKHLFIQNLFRR